MARHRMCSSFILEQKEKLFEILEHFEVIEKSVRKFRTFNVIKKSV